MKTVTFFFICIIAAVIVLFNTVDTGEGYRPYDNAVEVSNARDLIALQIDSIINDLDSVKTK